jgi:hypothetical protein
VGEVAVPRPVGRRTVPLTDFTDTGTHVEEDLAPQRVQLGIVVVLALSRLARCQVRVRPRRRRVADPVLGLFWLATSAPAQVPTPTRSVLGRQSVVSNAAARATCGGREHPRPT